jgi:uncharacterized membrane-anchored protein
MSSSPTPPRRPALMAKAPEVTALFWAIKVLTTGMGEAGADHLGGISIPLAGAVGVLVLVVALTLQFRADFDPAAIAFTVMGTEA